MAFFLEAIFLVGDQGFVFGDLVVIECAGYKNDVFAIIFIDRFDQIIQQTKFKRLDTPIAGEAALNEYALGNAVRCRQKNISFQDSVIQRVIRLVAADNKKSQGMQKLLEWRNQSPFAGRIGNRCKF